ncbi:hypothetical protein [Cryobacterium algoritolerans]|uniref:hypothetical protein n=1 Tax=Cryobacterium algoritolerans TaxID=1259184 RepID=UPI00141AE493|nr:hypothetical protein [Cryobacterium algoritolerans]
MAEQRTESWLRVATPEQVDAAHRAGELDDLMGVERDEAGNVRTSARHTGS